jgi:hypothetical protein
MPIRYANEEAWNSPFTQWLVSKDDPTIYAHQVRKAAEDFLKELEDKRKENLDCKPVWFVCDICWLRICGHHGCLLPKGLMSYHRLSGGYSCIRCGNLLIEERGIHANI